MRLEPRPLVAGLLVAALGVGVLVVLPHQADNQAGGLVTSASMPGWVSWALVVLGTLLAGSALKASTASVPEISDDATADWRGTGRVGLTIMIAAAYAMAMPWLGFILSTAAALLALGLVFGSRSWLGLALTAIIVPPTLYFFFTRLMAAPLPAGMLFR